MARRAALVLVLALLGGVAGAGPALAAAPAVSTFSPVSGQPGTVVTVTGTGFTGATRVAFGGAPGTGLTVVSDTTVRATVPSGALTGRVSVTTPGGTGTSAANFKVPPTVTGLSPTSGPEGTTVTVTGSALTSPTAVRLGGVLASFTGGSYGSLTFRVPAGAEAGTVAVTTAGGTATSSGTFTVTGPRLRTSRAVGPPTSSTTLTGYGFAANEAVDVYVDQTDVKLVATDSTGAFTVPALQVPRSAPPGQLWFTAVGRRSGSAAQVPFLVRTDWPQYRDGPPGRGLNPYENVLTPSTVGDAEPSWTSGIAYGNVPGGAVVVGGLAVLPLASAGTLVARRTDGSTAWSQPLASSYFNGPTPAVGSGVVVASSSDGKVHAFTLSTGAVRWTSAGPSDSGAGSPVIAGGTVYVPGASALQAFALSTGALQWSSSAPCTDSVSTPAVSASTVAFTCLNTSSSGSALYRVFLGRDGSTLGYTGVSTSSPRAVAPTYVGGSLLSLTDTALRLSGDLGYDVKWTATLPSGGAWQDLAAGLGLALVCGNAGVFAYQLGSGALSWSVSAVRCTASPTVAGDLLYVPEASGVAVLDRDGRLLAHLGAAGGTGPVAVCDGAVYAAVGLTGGQRWALPDPPSTAASAPARATLRPDPALSLT